MTEKHSYVTLCDRCQSEVQRAQKMSVAGLRFEIVKRWRVKSIYFMKRYNGSGSASSNMKLDLCHPCSKSFIDFMDGKAVNVEAVNKK